MSYVQERRRFGRAIGELQTVQLKLADMAIKVEAARLRIWRAAISARRSWAGGSISAAGVWPGGWAARVRALRTCQRAQT